MRTNPDSRIAGRKGSVLRKSAVAALGLALSGTATAIDFGDPIGGFGGSWDTTVSYGSVWRTANSYPGIICTSNGGTGRSCNYDDGTLNYDTGQVSNEFKFLTELQASYNNLGFFTRAVGYYDTEADNTLRTDLSDDAKDKVEKRIDLLDAYGYASFDLGNAPAQVRLGKQVVNWGESTFYVSGLSSLNVFDVTRLRGAAVNLREGLLAQEQAYFSISPTDNTTIEAFYQLQWNDTKPDPVGTWFGSNDLAVEGGEFVMLGFGAYGDLGTDFRPLGGFFDPNFQHVPRAVDDEPSDDGQYGVALRYFAPDFLGGTEFGFYYANFHSRLPVLSGRTGTQAGFGNAVGAATAAGAAAQALASGLSFDAAVQQATIAAAGAAAARGGDITQAELASWATVGANTFLNGGNVSALSSALATDQFGKTASYRSEFPEDIQMFGLTFSTDIAGIAWQGEYTYKKDTPLQLDDVELLFRAVSPLDALNPLPGGCPTNPNAIGALGCFGQQGPAGIDQAIQGWVEKDVSQLQSTITLLTDPMLGASVGTFVMEAAATYVHDFEDKSSGGPNGQGLRYDGPGTFVSGNAALASSHFGEVETSENFPDDFSWGYRLLASLQYDNLIGPWTVTPRVGWSQDVQGVTPGPGGNFIEGRTSWTVGVRGLYQNQWEWDLSYTEFSGADHHNLIRDRDFVALSVSFSF